MQSILVKSTAGFDMSEFLPSLGNLDQPLSKLRKIDSDTASVKISNDIKLVIDGSFNGALTSGKIDRVTVYQDKKPVLEITDTSMKLELFLALGADAGGGSALLSFFAVESYIIGNKGEDTLLGLVSARIFGGAGDDFLLDTEGNNNKFDGETGSDTVAYAGVASTGVTVNLSDASMNAGEAAGDTYRSIENVMGSAFDDTLIGTKKGNLLYGGDGNDTLVGAGGTDRLSGGDGLDYASYHGSSAGVTVDLVLTSRNTGDAEGDVYLDIEGIIGGAHGDNLTGDTNDNVIDGGAGNDIIDGVSGTDVLWGDGQSFGVDGADTFVFRGPHSGFKTIMDFDVQDHVQISRTGFGLSSNFTLVEGSTLIIAHAGPTATTGNPTFLVEQSTGNLYFDADGGGAGVAELIANVQFHSQEYLDLNDFTLV